MHRVSDGVRSTHSQDGGVVLDIRQGQMFNLNIVGSRILELLKSGACEPEIAACISRQFAVSQHLAETDVREFIEMLKKHQLVEECQLCGTV